MTGKFLNPVDTRTITLKCLTEVSNLNSPELEEKFIIFFKDTMEQIYSIIPPDTNLKQSYKIASTNDQSFLQDLAMFICTFLNNHLLPLEQNESLRELLLTSMHYLVELSRIEERELFKTCLDFWCNFVHGLFEEIQKLPQNELSPLMQLSYSSSIKATSGGAPDPAVLAKFPLREHMYTSILSKLRLVMIESMVRPEEVLY